MPRQARLDTPGTLHHGMERGLAALRLFQVKGDAEVCLARVARLANAGDVQLDAWALLPTQFHRRLRTGPQPLPTARR